MAWHFDEGSAEGVDLAGLTVVALVGAEENLAEGTTRESILYVPADASETEQQALRGWAAANHGALLGTVADVVATPIAFTREGEAFAVTVADEIALEGNLMPDRECCKMPYQVWYEPFDQIDDAIVGCAKTFSCDGNRLGEAWSRTEENCVFTGRFGGA